MIGLYIYFTKIIRHTENKMKALQTLKQEQTKAALDWWNNLPEAEKTVLLQRIRAGRWLMLPQKRRYYLYLAGVGLCTAGMFAVNRIINNPLASPVILLLSIGVLTLLIYGEKQEKQFNIDIVSLHLITRLYIKEHQGETVEHQQ